MTATAEDRIHSLGIWRGPIEISPLVGGITNRNYLVGDAGRRFVVRLGEDIPVHHISRSNEVAASRAAYAAGLSPAASAELFDLIKALHREGMTVIMVEQNALDALAIADRGYLLVDGSNAREGPAGALAADAEVRHAFLGG